MPRKQKPKVNYLDNKELEDEIAKWKASDEDPTKRVPSEKLGKMLIELHDGVLKHANFYRYPQDLKDEMKSFSLYRILKCGLKSFNPEKSTAFAYFSRSAFLNYYTVLHRYYQRLNKH